MLPLILAVLGLGAGGIFAAKKLQKAAAPTSHIPVAGGAGVVAVNKDTPVGLLLAKMTWDSTGKFQLTPNNMTQLNEILNYMKANRAVAVKVPDTVKVWLADHGMAATRFT